MTTLKFLYYVILPITGLYAADLEIAISDQQVDLTIDLPVEGYQHYRLDASPNLDGWMPIASMSLIDGEGTKENIDDRGEGLPASMFYRVVEDDSASNVLNLPATLDDYETVNWPAHLLTPPVLNSDNTPANNSVTDEGALLGRVLFYDKKLSANYTVSCASCHQQDHGFSDPDAFSTGFEGGQTGRNSMGLTNARFYERGSFFWDERAATLEDQVLRPIQDPTEMGLTLEELVSRVSSYTYYEQLFVDAFGDAEVTSQRISLVLAQFVRSIVSNQSKYDIGEATNFANFTAEERLGQQLFNGTARCSACHVGPNFVGIRVENNGLENPIIDPGVGGVSGVPPEVGTFKMPSLRNIEHTAPYMHDGRFATLADVVEHYNSGVVANNNLGPPLRNPDGTARRLNLTQAEKNALVAFLLTLTDDTIATDPKWSDPFADGAQ